MTLAIDYAWTHPSPAAIYADGYRAVMRYLSHDTTKDLSVAEAKALHDAGLSVGLVWETTATRAGAGYAAGTDDAQTALGKAAALGFPNRCPIFYAVDYDANPVDVLPYFRAIHAAHVAAGAGRPIGVYGSYRVVEAIITAGLATFGWQTMAWSWDAANSRYLVSGKAHLYQRVKRTLGPIAGVSDTAWDEDAILIPFPLWGPPSPAIITPAPAPAPAPLPKPGTLLAVDGRMGAKTVAALQRAIGASPDGWFGFNTATALQRHLGVTQDGDVGPRTVLALQRRVRDTADGRWPSVIRPHTANPTAYSTTTAHLQAAINGHRF